MTRAVAVGTAPNSPWIAARCSWGMVVRGRASDLIAGGIVRGEWLPGLPGNNKKTVTVCPDKGEFRQPRSSNALRITRDSQHLYSVYVPWTEEEEREQRAFETEIENDVSQAPGFAAFLRYEAEQAGREAWDEILEAGLRAGVVVRLTRRLCGRT